MEKDAHQKIDIGLPYLWGKFGNILGCSCNKCDYHIDSAELGLCCAVCGRLLKWQDTILVDTKLDAVSNHLEDLDYDALHRVSVEASKHLGHRWGELIENNFADQREVDILEIGAGTGFLTLGLVLNVGIRRLVVSDLSMKFLKHTQNIIKANLSPAEYDDSLNRTCFLNCSIDELPIRPNSLDVVVANSVLHHVFDYELALIKIRRILRPGGVAIFSEPVIEGKAFVGLIASLLQNMDARANEKAFTEIERRAMGDLAILCTQEFWGKVAHQKKHTADDKHLFSVSAITKLAKEIGYVEVQAIAYDPISDGLLKAVEDSFRIMNIRVEPLKEFSYVFESFQKQLINEIPNKVLTPHAFLIFRK